MEANPTLPPTIRSELCSHAARLMSFKTKKSTPKSTRWPHPESFKLTINSLASAGYFHDPVDGESDRTTCWMCGESMKGWAEDDDPWTLHHKWSPECSFGRLALLEHQRDTGTQSWSDSPNQTWGSSNEWFPRGPTMIEARLATFCGPSGPWKHEGENGVPTRLELARAGFHFTPNLFKKGRKYDVDDTTSCCYCHRSITEWEPEDDPVSVHLKKGPCIFFSAVQPSEPVQKVKSKAPAKKISKVAKPPGAFPEDSVIVVDAPDTDAPSGSQRQSKSNPRRKKGSSVATSQSTKHNGRRVVSATSVIPSEESDAAEPDDEERLRPRSQRIISKTNTPASVPPSSPDTLDHQTSKKPPVTLSKSTTRLSRSISNQSLSSSTGRSTAGNRPSRTRSGAGSNVSVTLDAIGSKPNAATREIITTDDEAKETEKPRLDAKKTGQRGKVSKAQERPASNATTSDNEEDSRSKRRIPKASTDLKKVEEPSRVFSSEDEKVENPNVFSLPSTKNGFSKAPSKVKPPASANANATSNAKKSTKAETSFDQGVSVPKNVSPIDLANLSGSATGIISAQTIFVGFNPQAPQLYPGRLPVAPRVVNSQGKREPESKARPKDPKESSDRNQTASGDAETEALLEEYFGQDPVEVPPGWLANPYNPSRPFPPLTEKEKEMPLIEYFSYRAQQEEEAFLRWIEEKKMKPWLEAVENGRKLIEGLMEDKKIKKKKNHRLNQKKIEIEIDENGVDENDHYDDVYVSPVKNRSNKSKMR